jgi:uncharacterized protein YdaU (DUF1376 family)
MHYYQFNIGDYQSHTAHLTEMEDLAYRRLLDWAYLHESPIPLDVEQISRLIRMRSHSDCIASVLQEFFVRTDDGWVSQRVEQEIEAVGAKKEKARASAKARWDANALRAQSEGNAPITQDPLPITQDTEPKIEVPNGTRQRETLTPAAPTDEIVALYNEKLPMLPRVSVVNESRRRAISARWREVVTADRLDREKGLEFFAWYFDMVSQSKFLTGKAKDWKADIDFLFNPSKFPRVIEGFYHKEQ